ECMQTLDGIERPLSEDTLLITDDSGPIAIAGVMGGATTEVSERTRHILLESANFNAIRIRRTSQALRLACEAAQRLGRGGDQRLEVEVPSHRLDVSIAADLIEDIARIHGYEAIPLTLIKDVLPPQHSQPLLAGIEQTRNILVGCGLTEIISYGLTSLDSVNRALLNVPPVDSSAYIRVANPISQERELLRQSLV